MYITKAMADGWHTDNKNLSMPIGLAQRRAHWRHVAFGKDFAALSFNSSQQYLICFKLLQGQHLNPVHTPCLKNKEFEGLLLCSEDHVSVMKVFDAKT